MTDQEYSDYIRSIWELNDSVDIEELLYLIIEKNKPKE